jgi:hypothetical protein
MALGEILRDLRENVFASRSDHQFEASLRK